MTKVTNNFVSNNIVTNKVVTTSSLLSMTGKIMCGLLVEACANLKYNCKVTQTSFCTKYSGLVFMEMRKSFHAVSHPAGDRADPRRGCAPSLPKMAHIPSRDRADLLRALQMPAGASCNASEFSSCLCRDLAHGDGYFVSVWQPAICFPFFVWIY
jgi:hypothetical protein